LFVLGVNEEDANSDLVGGREAPKHYILQQRPPYAGDLMPCVDSKPRKQHRRHRPP
jgi:hypothetical protein